MAPCFGIVIPDLDDLRSERYALWRAGVSYTDWRQMTRWQRHDLLARVSLEKKGRAEALKGKGWRQILGAVLGRVLGLD